MYIPQKLQMKSDCHSTTVDEESNCHSIVLHSDSITEGLILWPVSMQSI